MGKREPLGIIGEDVSIGAAIVENRMEAPNPWAFLVAQLVKNLPAMRETWVRSLGWEDPLEKGTATHSSILAWRIPWSALESLQGLRDLT